MAFFTESPFGSITLNGMPSTSCSPHVGKIKRSWAPPVKRLFVLTADATLSMGRIVDLFGNYTARPKNLGKTRPEPIISEKV
jgi:hypothetical protein